MFTAYSSLPCLGKIDGNPPFGLAACRVTESWMKAQGQAIYQEKLCGYVPGIAVGDG